MSEQLTWTQRIYFVNGRRGCKELREGEPSAPATAGTLPRIARLMALAIRLEQLLQEGTVINQAELARIGHVSRARVTQILNLLNLAPDIQDAILYLPRTEQGRSQVKERDLRPIAAQLDWTTQREMRSRLHPSN